ncbi:Fic family protein [Candidatus Fermentibacterales bacterium]|nr:Fic family protein [Candidatus Fermentibacterales bacterium]
MEQTAGAGSGILSEPLMRTLGSIDEFKGRWPMLSRLPKERLGFHRREMVISTIVSSCRMDGIDIDAAQLRELLARQGGVHDLRSRQERMAAGLARVMREIMDTARDEAFSTALLRRLHLALLRHSPEDELHRGEYRWVALEPSNLDSFASCLWERSADTMEPFSPSTIPAEMERLVSTTLSSLESGPAHPIVTVAWFTARLLAVHPFQSAMGRLSRAASLLLMLRSGYEHLLYHSLDALLEERREEYHNRLAGALGAAAPADPEADGEHGLLSWTRFFASTILSQCEAAESRMKGELLLAPLPGLSEEILSLARQQGRVTLGAAGRMTGANRNTLKVHFRRLCAQGLLAMHGSGRGVWYSPE